MFWHAATKSAKPVLVTEQKIVLWLWTILHRNPYMGLENLDQHIKAAIDLWRTQKAQGLVKGENPRSGALIRGLLRYHKRNKEARREALFLDRGIGSLADGYRLIDVPRICDFFWRDSSVKSFRDRLDFLLGHSMLFRSEDQRRALLSRLSLWDMDNEGPTPCQTLIISIARSKTNKEGRYEVGAAARHKDVLQCPVGALAMYLFWRFHLAKEPFPDLSTNQRWYGTYLFRGVDPCKPLSYNHQHNSIQRCFKALNIQSSRSTHTMRGQGKHPFLTLHSFTF
jgi:hypothetical protein